MRPGINWRVSWLSVAFAAVAALATTACATSLPEAPGGKLQIVAAESFWGSIAAQLGGDRVTVRSIISSPDTDPHDYEATAADARAVAGASYVVYNGFSYDPWMDRLINSNPSGRRIALKVQTLLGLKSDDNPHRWYSPDDVTKVAAQIAADYKKIDPASAAYFDQQWTTFETVGMKDYNDTVALIRQKYAGTPVGATESIVSPLADALGLKIMTPYSFLQAVSEGTEPTARDKSAADSQIENKQIAVLVFNSQNVTPDVQRLVDAAKAKGIPVVSVTETLVPANATFQDWQTNELKDLAAALAKATGK